MTRKVLFVDDDQDVLDLLAEVSADWDVETLLASSGDEALRIVADQNIQVMVIDQIMPGISGLEVLERLRAEAPEVVRVVMTGYADVDSAIDAINQGSVFRFLKKPFSIDQVEEVLREAIQEYDKHQSREMFSDQMERYLLLDEEPMDSGKDEIFYFQIMNENGELRPVNPAAEQVVLRMSDNGEHQPFTFDRLIPEIGYHRYMNLIAADLTDRTIHQTRIQFNDRPYAVLAMPRTEKSVSGTDLPITLVLYPLQRVSKTELDLYRYVRDLEHEADARDRGLRFLYQMSKKIGTAQNFDELVGTIFADLRTILDFDIGLLANFQEKLANVFVRSSYTLEKEQMRYLRSEVIEQYHNSGLNGGENPDLDIQVRNWKGKTFTDMDPECPGMPGANITIPMRNPMEQILGILHISSCERISYSAEEIRLFATFSSRIALVLHITNNLFLFNQMREMATTDSLTHLYNRRYFEEQIEKEIERCRRYNSALSLLILDIDHFKQVNDSHGHLVGDKVLRELGRVIESSIRHIDIPVRYGGEEFAIILPETDAEGAAVIGERLCRQIAEHDFQLHGDSDRGNDSLHLTVSIGISHLADPDELTSRMLISNADKALYYAKEHGRNRSVLYDSLKIEPV